MIEFIKENWPYILFIFWFSPIIDFISVYFMKRKENKQ